MPALPARRDFLHRSLALAAAALLPAAEPDEQVIPFLDSRPFDPTNPRLPWEQTTSWLTPLEHFFWVGHYGYPEVDPAAWRLHIGGLVRNPRVLTLEQLQSRPKTELTLTLECSGNPPAGGLVGNGRFAGTPLAPILEECGLPPEGIEVVFFGADRGSEKIRGGEYPQQFARSLAVSDARRPDILLAWEMNRQPLTKEHGAPVRLVVPGWYGVAWVKWLERIEVQDRRFMGRFMGRDYVTIRGEQQGPGAVWRETSVGRMNLKSVVARVTRSPGGVVRIAGAAWSDGASIGGVEVRIDDGPWTPAQLSEGRDQPHAWKFWSLDWRNPAPGEHTLISRATDASGKVQPAPEDPFITLKKTYWEANQQAPRKIKV